jgi:murein DD-endopeptidase MepM/ murein hydrolase activator NlpD
MHLSGAKLILLGLLSAMCLMLVSVGLYHWVFLTAARAGWPIVDSVVKLVAKDDTVQRERFLRENLDAMAKKVGEMQAKLLQLDALGERVSGLAGLPVTEAGKRGSGGALVSERSLSMEELQAALNDLEVHTGQRVDMLTVVESRLFDLKIKKLMIPTQHPVASGNLGSFFGWRIDPLNGRSALHTIVAAAGGVVVTQEFHAAYGNMIEIDHGNDLVTRYAHASQVHVKKGDLIKRGQKIAEVGTTGRSTGPHLHFEVLVQGIPQDPQKFLTAGQTMVNELLAKNDKNLVAKSVATKSVK